MMMITRSVWSVDLVSHDLVRSFIGSLELSARRSCGEERIDDACMAGKCRPKSLTSE